MTETPAQEAPPRTELRIEASLAAKINLADYQNAVPILRELKVTNDTDNSRERLLLSVSSDPCFFEPKRWHIDVLGPGQTCQIPNLDLRLDGPLLTRLSESEFARVTFQLEDTNSNSPSIITFKQDVELLPRNQWGGLSELPEMVAAFVQPNDPAVDRLLKRAAQLLRDSNRNPALNGYESGPKHAWELLSAIWGAVAAEQLDYALPPSSFEQTGQKVRSAGQILDAKIATCLDVALLFAAAAEQTGLNPLVVFTTGHAFAGCWLRPEEFTTTVVDDPSALRKRLVLKEVVLFETTLVTNISVPPFSRACEIGEKLLADDVQFQAAVDIRRARMHKIRPLAAAETPVPTAHTLAGTEGSSATSIEEAPDFPEELAAEQPEIDAHSLKPADRIARWQRKLLDLSLRNSLLNFRKNKRAVTFEAPDPSKLEDVLASGKALKILPRPELMDGSDPRSLALHEGRTHDDVHRDHALSGLGKCELFARASQEELESRLVELYRAARASLEEGGANTLFLALGFLVWTQDGKDQQKHRAPLILIPVSLNRRSIRSGFTLTLHEDEPQFNPTLLEMLRQDFQLNIGVQEGSLPKDDFGLDVKSIWDRVSNEIKEVRGWEIVPDVLLSTFSFAKHLMWKDLAHRTGQLRDNPVVRHLIDSPRELYRSDIDFISPGTLDHNTDPSEIFCPLAADSSQLAAIMSAARGKDFVLIGPPGTGKSQTISNLIAHCIASGKRILFVAEKIAALDVVHRRLQKEGLGQFCLEIHSSKAKKAAVLEALGTAWNSRGSADAEAWEVEAHRLRELRDHLNLYVQRLHQRHANGITVFQAFGCAIAGRNVPVVNFAWQDSSSQDAALLKTIRGIIARLEIYSAKFGTENLTRTPLAAVRQIVWTPLWQTEFVRSVQQAHAAANDVSIAYRHLAALASLPLNVGLSAKERVAVHDLACVLPTCVGRPWAFTTRVDASLVINELQSAIALAAEYKSVVRQLGEPWSRNVTAACRSGITLLREQDTLKADLPMPWPVGIVADLERGTALLKRVAEGESQLSNTYDVSRVNVSFLESEWERAKQAFWPISVFRKRRVRAALAPAMKGAARPDPAVDLAVLGELERMRAEISALDLRALPTSVWSGLQTHFDAACAALDLQAGLSKFRTGGHWSPAKLDLIASGLCGHDLKRTLDSMLRLAAIGEELESLNWLSTATDGLWAAENTNKDALAAAADFCDDWRSGELHCDHEIVARGDCGAFLQSEHELRLQKNRLRQSTTDYAHLSGKTDGLWRGLETNPDEVMRALQFGDLLERTISSFAHTSDDNLAVRNGIERLCRASATAEAIQSAADAFGVACSSLITALATVAESGQFSEEHKNRFLAEDVAAIQKRYEEIGAAGPRLQLWCSWMHAREEALAQGLAELITAIEGGEIGPAQLARAFEVNYSRWWLDRVVSSDTVLRKFVSTEHERRIEDFQALDDRYTALTRDWIRAKLCSGTPNANSVVVNSEWGVLRHELTKKKRHLPLRELMTRIPSVVTTLTPCLLMSPLSIAQYLSLSTATFDVVVFDEASQITVWDAIGAMARAKQVVMVGDPKQLPPTNFFGRAEDESELPDSVTEDLESILDECIGANLPSIQLSWHYRSRHESLIAFSNRRYYNGKLVTFPSPVTEDCAVKFRYVPGIYEKGGARTNPGEARAVVRDIVSRLRSDDFKHSGHSIGVVTFNAEQQKLIEDLFDAERREDPSIEPFFEQEGLEPVFVKNLESVQGDERDIIYFSITYGPDIAGKVSMNFGPMNRDGGERRLNVAITRSRRELLVFSSLRPEQIDLSRTQSTGVSELKHFLEFAERGPRAFAEAVSGITGDFESEFERYVASALTSRGWTVHTQIGVSAFRIDLGVVHPDASGIYLAGIECDGATYHRSATARDRDKLRQHVLRDLGWEIFRVWSTDWWIDSETTLNRLDAQIRSTLACSREKRKTSPSSVATPIHEPNPEDLPNNEPQLTADNGLSYRSNHDGISVTAAGGIDPSQFFERSYNARLTEIVAKLVENEGPILDEVLSRRVARLHGWQRTGARITDRVTRVASKIHKKTKENVGAFFWPPNLEAGQIISFRTGLDRAVDEICMPELVSLATEVLKEHGDTDPVMAMAKAVGLQRLRTTSRSRLESALQRAQQTLQR